MHAGSQIHYRPFYIALVPEISPNCISVVGDEHLLIDEALLDYLLVVQRIRSRGVLLGGNLLLPLVVESGPRVDLPEESMLLSHRTRCLLELDGKLTVRHDECCELINQYGQCRCGVSLNCRSLSDTVSPYALWVTHSLNWP